MEQLKYYINLGCPPIRTPVEGNELFVRPEVGFNPSWFHACCDANFSEKWHKDVKFRLETYEKMAKEIKKRFPGYNIGRVLDDRPPDLLTGVYGIGIMDSIFRRPLRFFSDKWPVPVGNNMSDEEIKSLKPIDPENNPFLTQICEQMNEIYSLTANLEGYLNWQGNLNTGFRFRGDDIFTDLIINQDLMRHLFEVITETYIKGVKFFYKNQQKYGVDNRFATIANCTVNMVGPELYAGFLLDYDIKISNAFESIGIHNCAWTVTPYIDPYSKVPNVSYIDMGIDSDLAKAKNVFPLARRNCLYTSVDLKNKSEKEIRTDFEFIAQNLAPCDIGMPDIEYDVPDRRIMYAWDLCEELSEKYGG
jgi:hypothetical protein